MYLCLHLFVSECFIQKKFVRTFLAVEGLKLFILQFIQSNQSPRRNDRPEIYVAYAGFGGSYHQQACTTQQKCLHGYLLHIGD